MISANSPSLLANYFVLRKVLDPKEVYLSDDDILRHLKLSCNYLELALRKAATQVFGKAFKKSDRVTVKAMSSLLVKINANTVNALHKQINGGS